MNKSTFRKLLLQIHQDQRGAVSLETILLLGAVALPILIFIIKVGWPKIRGTFVRNLDILDSKVNAAKQGN
jgi:hypothetical protein